MKVARGTIREESEVVKAREGEETERWRDVVDGMEELLPEMELNEETREGKGVIELLAKS